MFKFLFTILSVVLVFSNAVFAVWEQELQQSREKTSIILSVFSTELLLNFVFALITIVLTLVISKVVKERITGVLEKQFMWDGEWREELIGVISRTMNIAILCVGFSVTLGVLGVDMWIFMWWIWFGLGFTLKTFLTNFVSGIMMVTQGCYHNGDIININGKVGKIVRINALFTTLEQFDGVVFYVPNIEFSEQVVENYQTNDKRRVEVELQVDYSTDIVKAKGIIFKVIEQFPNVLQAPTSDIFITELGDSWVKMDVRFWISSRDEYFSMKSNVTETINLAFKQAGIRIPFSQVTISSRDTDQKLPI